MAGTVCVRWTLVPTHAPIPWRHCPTCAAMRAFASSGKIRLNANGRRLDAWLIYRCITCDQTWNRTLFERRPVHEVPRAELEALQRSAPASVGPFEQDVAALRRQADRVELCVEVMVIKPAPEPAVCLPGFLPDSLPDRVELTLCVPHPTGCRLDRLLAQELALPRTRLQAMVKAGTLGIMGEGRKAFRRPLMQGRVIILQLGDAPTTLRDGLSARLFA